MSQKTEDRHKDHQIWVNSWIHGGVGGRVGRHTGFASDIMVQCHFLWPHCVPCPRKHRNRHQDHQFWVDSYRLMAIRRFSVSILDAILKKNFSEAPILVNF